MKNVMVAVISSLLVGWVDLETKINTDNLLSSRQSMLIVKGDINFEVSSCNDFEDSRKESKSDRIKNKVPEIFRDAEYVECYKQKLIHSPILNTCWCWQG